MKTNRKYDGMKYRWLKEAEKFILLLLVVYLVFRFIIGFSVVRGNSMESTLHNKEVVMFLRLTQSYEKGDVVRVKVPSGGYYVKRIIATQGDTIDIRSGKVYINDQCFEEPYAMGTTTRLGEFVTYPLTLKEGEVFIMGDNREQSTDSRTFGVVGERQIKGKLYVRIGKFYIHKIK